MSRTLTILLLVLLAGCASTPGVDDDAPPVATPPPLPNRGGAGAAAGAEETMDSRERAKILAEVTAYYRDLTARDWDAFARHFWRGAVVSTIWTPGDGSERRVDFISVPEYIAQIDLGPDSTLIFEQRMGTAEVHFDRGIAQVWAQHHVRFGEPGDVREWIDVDAFTLMKHVEMWKISSVALSSR